MEAAKPGVSVLSLCEKGDAYIMVETGKVFKKEKEMKKGEARICPLWVFVFFVGFFVVFLFCFVLFSRGGHIKEIRSSRTNCWQCFLCHFAQHRVTLIAEGALKTSMVTE